jgi:hypothetical protein
VSYSLCYSKCYCDLGFGGSDYSLSQTRLILRDSLRLNLCQGIYNLSLASDSSSFLLDGLVSSLLNSFEPSEIVSPLTKTYCKLSFEYLSHLARNWYLANAKVGTAQAMVDLLSAFVSSDVFDSGSGSGLGSANDLLTHLGIGPI